MKYYKDAQNNVFAYDQDIDAATLNAEISKHGLTAITASEYDAIINTLSVRKERKKAGIRVAFESAAKSPVTDANSIVWDGGYDSALKLDAARRLAALAGATTVTFFDNSNTPHNLTMTQAEAVILTVASDYQTKFAKKQTLMGQVDALPATATQADLDAIVVQF